MRGEYIRSLLPDVQFSVINTDIPLYRTPHLFRSIGWRYKIGPLINNINDFILKNINADNYDLVWIDKGVFIKPSVVQLLKSRSKQIVHFTPDPAFAYHRSRLFFESLPLYDHCITTKYFEIKKYQQHGVKTILSTQGYDPFLHKPYHSFYEKKGVVFIGHKEDEREEIISGLIEAGIDVTLAGIKWKRLLTRYKYKTNFVYKGTELLGEDYAKTISSAQIGLGLLSKWIPEKHTTRTFEIPACGTALLTEKNDETSAFFLEDEALFFTDKNEIIEKVQYYLSNPQLLNVITNKGTEKIMSSNLDYKSIMSALLRQIGIV